MSVIDLPTQREGMREGTMFWFGCLFLLSLGAVIHHHRDVLDLNRPELVVELSILGALWPVFILEAILRFLQRDKSKSTKSFLIHTIFICLIPPLRMGVRHHGKGQYVWFPFMGWRQVDKHLRKELEKAFSIPMILIALMVLPVLAIEYAWEDTINQNAALRLTLVWANTIIWFAFAVEFLVMISVAPKKLRFIISQWINLAIILLPIVEFLPLLRTLRLGRVMRVQQLSKMGRLYRLRGLAMRAWRAILILGVLQRIFGSSLDRRLERLQELLEAKEEEIQELREEIDEVKERIAEKNAKVLNNTILAQWRKRPRTSTSTADSSQ